MNKTIDKLINGGKKVLIGLSLTGLIGCVTYAKRDYDKYPAHRKDIAYYNLKQILSDLCNPKFQINNDGFYCHQGISGSLDATGEPMQYSWDEIMSVRCVGRQLVITGEYDTSKIGCQGPIWHKHLKQCDDLEEAFRIYLKERKK